MRLRGILLAVLTAAALGQGGEARAQDAASRRNAVTVLSYGGIFQESYTAAVLEPFAASHRLSPGYIGEANSAGMLDRLRSERSSPKADVVIMDTTTAAIACAEGLVEPVTLQIVPALDDLYPAALSAGGRCGPGVSFDDFVIVYDAQKVTPAPSSIRILWNQRWHGQVAISAPPNVQGLALTAILANADSADWRSPDGAFRELRQLARSVSTYDPHPDGYTAVLNGTVALATGWNARAQLYRDRSGGRLGVVVPDEGTVVQINTINLVRGAPHRAAALAFMNYALSPAVQADVARSMFYAPTNMRAELSPEIAARTAATPFEMAKEVPVDWDEMRRLRDSWGTRWASEVLAAARDDGPRDAKSAAPGQP